jgi:D-lactate dehydrogenase (cytochrome)
MATKEDLAGSGLFGPIVGHVGDGNFHVGVMFDRNDANEVKRVKAFSDRLAARAIAMDGTCTGEHGVGQGKMAYLEDEFGPALDLMRAVKRAVDPDNIMNPGKIFSFSEAAGIAGRQPAFLPARGVPTPADRAVGTACLAPVGTDTIS